MSVYGLRYNYVFCRYCIAFHRRWICALVLFCAPQNIASQTILTMHMTFQSCARIETFEHCWSFVPMRGSMHYSIVLSSASNGMNWSGLRGRCSTVHFSPCCCIIIVVECWTQKVTPLCPDLQFRDVALLCSNISVADHSNNCPIVLQTFRHLYLAEYSIVL